VDPIWTALDAPRSLSGTLAPQRNGRADPTTRLAPGEFVRAAITPDGPGTLRLTWAADPSERDDDGLTADAWGPGADWLLSGVDRLVGASDRPGRFEGAHPTVDRALRSTRSFRIGACGDLYHLLLPTVLAQRITAREAVRQWARLCRRLGEPAPGPAEVVEDLVLPPSPSALARRPAWWFHPLGIEASRATTLTEIARHSDRLRSWAESGPALVADQLAAVPGVGPWTIGCVLGPALGDPDAVPIGDFHFPSTVSWALAREPRADDGRMLELLAPYRGQRGRVLRAIVATCPSAPARGPRRRVLPISRW
jgi:3-methyladenine DNA glycosylase/8-oxoguanine DNA glycosylase